MIIGLLIILAYLIGSIPSGLIIGKTFYNIDIREHGSGNLGGTNSFRVLGKKQALLLRFPISLKVLLQHYYLLLLHLFGMWMWRLILSFLVYLQL